MDEHLTGTWEEFETGIRNTIGGNFRWNVRPQDNRWNREMIVRYLEVQINQEDNR